LYFLERAVELALFNVAEATLSEIRLKIISLFGCILELIAVKSYRVCRVSAKEIVELTTEHKVALGRRQFINFLDMLGTVRVF
jgi:hypothetical protein